jgi:MoaA/NifB/PqqE/SkfB family radical SAM enzyme
LKHIVQLINNFKTNKPLLENIPCGDILKKDLASIDEIYNKKLDFTCVIFSMFRSFLFMNLYTAFLIKQNNPTIEIMMGGPHIELSPTFRNLLRFIKVFEYIVEGDIQETIKLYLSNKLDPFQNHQIYNDPSDDYLMPIYEKHEISLFGNIFLKSAQGCPNNCSFCPGSYGKFKVIKADDLVNSFEYYNKLTANFSISKKRNIKCFITDPTLNYSRKKLDNILDGLIRIKNIFTIESYLSYNHIDLDKIYKFVESGMTHLIIGIDTFDRNKLTDVMECKNKLVIENKKIIEALYKHVVSVLYTLVYNCPGETDESFQYDFEMCKELIKEYTDLKLFRLQLYPYIHQCGSHMFINPEQYGIRIENWEPLNCYDDQMNEIITQAPKFYYNTIPEKTYEKRYYKMSQLNDLCKFPVAFPDSH